MSTPDDAPLPPAAPVRPVASSRGGRVARIALFGAGVAVFLAVGPKWPKDQTVHYVLGDSASRVSELDARWAPAGDGDDWARQATFRYGAGQAPRVVTHQPRLPDGDYTVEIDLVADRDRSTVRRAVTLESTGSTSIDLAQAVPR